MAAAEVKPTVKGLNRTEALASIMQDPVWDVVVVGGGATGAGVALDAASRGLKTLLLEAQDFCIPVHQHFQCRGLHPAHG